MRKALRLIAARLLYALLVLLGVSVLVFFLIRLGGDPAALLAPPDASAADLAQLRHELGFDRPLLVQYADFLGNAVQGDFGQSVRYQESALDLVLQRLPATAELACAALLLSLVIAVPLGIVSALRRDSALDRGGLIASLVGESFPSFWLGIMLILVFSERLGWLPPSGRGGWRHLVMPALSLASYSTAIIMRLLRSSMIDVLRADYIRTARGAGVREAVVVLRYALRNAAAPALTVIALQVGALLGGAVVTEEIFAYPGMGRLAIQAIENRDFPVVQAFVVVMAAMIVAINLAVDIVCGLLDPRVRA